MSRVRRARRKREEKRKVMTEDLIDEMIIEQVYMHVVHITTYLLPDRVRLL